MSCWRPSNNCIYVVSDINNLNNELDLILSRILPLRKTGGQLDKLIFLGNYICGSRSYETINKLIKAKNENPEQIICILGDSDSNFLKSLNQNDNPEYYKLWLSSGGDNALLGYLSLVKSDIYNPYLLKRQYVNRFIQKEHIDFMKSLIPYYELDNYIFVHGGCDPNLPLEIQNPDVLIKDRSVFNLISNSVNTFKCRWNKVIITGGVGKKDGKPLVHDKFITLDGSYAEKLYVMELNSRELFSARKGKSRLVKESIG